MKHAILVLGLIFSLSSFADTAQPAGVSVAGVGVAGIAIPTPGTRYVGTITTAQYPYAHLNGYYNMTSNLLVKGQTGTGTMSVTSFSGEQHVYAMNCSRAWDRVGTKTCIEISTYQLKYITTANPRTGLVTLSVLDNNTGALTVIGYLRTM